MRTLEKHCQCSCCDKYNFSRADLDCSGGLLGDILADNETFNALWACKVKQRFFQRDIKGQFFSELFFGVSNSPKNQPDLESKKWANIKKDL